jgi:VacB/RNase II family 3'-5' exoribonuclease
MNWNNTYSWKKYHAPVRNAYRPAWEQKEGIISFDSRKTTVETKEWEVYYIFETRTAGYLHGDKVLIEVTRKASDGKLPEARPIRLLRRSDAPLVMELIVSKSKKKSRSQSAPSKDENHFTYKILDELGGLEVKLEKPITDERAGDLYLVQYISTSTVRIIRFFGNRSDPEVAEKIILFRFGVRLEWPLGFDHIKVKQPPSIPPPQSSSQKEALEFHSLLPDNVRLWDRSLFPRVKISGHERMDFREWPTMTIDGADAKDLDDAISLSRYANGDFLLWVHIADVTEYVEEDTPLDREAVMRGTSIYIPGHVIPMLPEILSNDRCSLHPGEPKLVLSILMRIDAEGKVKESFISEGIIESLHRGIYDEVFALKVEIWKLHYSDLGDSEGSSIFPQTENRKQKIENPTPLWHDTIDQAWKLFDILSQRRKNEGKILFETTECYFDIDENRQVKSIKKRERNDAHMLIEECMVIANEEVAKWCAKQKLPFLSRVHETPGNEQMQAIAEIIGKKELFDSIEPYHIRTFLESQVVENERYRLSRLLLPKMAKARYADMPIRHFWLSLLFYSHFTSPIRRYPDLLVHRIIKKFLHNELDPTTKARYTKDMKKYGKNLTEREKRAEDVERAIDALMMCRYMAKYVGQIFSGKISWITENALYVELESGVEGSLFFGKNAKKLVYFSTQKWIPTKLIHDPIRWSLKDKSGKEIYTIWQSIKVRIQEVDMENRRIEMEEV